MDRGESQRILGQPAFIAPTAQKRRPGRPYPPEPHLWFDGVFIKENELPRNFPSWRVATMGGVYTELHALHTKPRFFSKYFTWLQDAAGIAMLPPLSNVTETSIHNAIVGLLNKNMYFSDTLTRLSIVPTLSPNDYGSDVMVSALFLETKPLERSGFAPRTQGLLVKVLEDSTKALNRRANVQWLSDPAAWISQRLLKKSLWSEHLLLNSKGRVANAIEGMVYALINGETITPPLSEGVRFDPIRPLIEEAYFSATGNIIAKKPLTLEMLNAAEEVFLASSVHGIESVLGVNDRRYSASVSNLVCEKLNRIYFPELYL